MNGIDGAVLVQPTPYGWDNSYLLHCKQADPERFKAVVLVDPFSESGAADLQKLVQSDADGLRINLHIRPLQDWENRHFYELLDKCVDLDVPVCFQLTPDYLNLLQSLAGDFPTQLVIDHLGRPKVGCQPTDKDFTQLLALSRHSNMYIKLSGMNYYSNETAPYRDTWNLLKIVKQEFGADHCLWGSDYPFVDEHWSYSENLNLVRRSLRFTQDELEWILHKTARSLWWNNTSESNRRPNSD